MQATEAEVSNSRCRPRIPLNLRTWHSHTGLLQFRTFRPWKDVDNDIDTWSATRVASQSRDLIEEMAACF